MVVIKGKEFKLKPCPFCGYEKPRFHESKKWFGNYMIYCPNCGAMVGDEDELGTDEYEAAELWNSRVG